MITLTPFNHGGYSLSQDDIAQYIIYQQHHQQFGSHDYIAIGHVIIMVYNVNYEICQQ